MNLFLLPIARWRDSAACLLRVGQHSLRSLAAIVGRDFSAKTASTRSSALGVFHRLRGRWLRFCKRRDPEHIRYISLCRRSFEALRFAFFTPRTALTNHNLRRCERDSRMGLAIPAKIDYCSRVEAPLPPKKTPSARRAAEKQSAMRLATSSNTCR